MTDSLTSDQRAQVIADITTTAETLLQMIESGSPAGHEKWTDDHVRIINLSSRSDDEIREGYEKAVNYKTVSADNFLRQLNAAMDRALKPMLQNGMFAFVGVEEDTYHLVGYLIDALGTLTRARKPERIDELTKEVQDLCDRTREKTLDLLAAAKEAAES